MEDEREFEEMSFPQVERGTDTALPDFGAEEEEAEAPAAEHQTEDLEPPVESVAPEGEPSTDVPAAPDPGGPPPAETDRLERMDARLEEIAGAGQKIASEVREMHKLYHTEFAGRLKAMQDELEHYRKIDKGRAYDDILAAIARIYINNETLAEEVAEPKAKKSIRYMLLDLEELLSVYGMTKLRSAPGEKRDPRHCQVLNRIPTDDPAKHDTVAKSWHAGFYIGNRTVMKEVVDVCIYEGKAPAQGSEEEQTVGGGDAPATE